MKFQTTSGGINRWVTYLLPFILASCLSGGGGGGNSGSVAGAPVPPVPPGTCLSVTYAAPSGAANDIVFTFDKAYSCGQFANGDWWVSKDASPAVTITSITPTFAGGKNGYMVNPSNTNQQSYDSTTPLGGEPPFVAPPPLPLVVAGNSSVVKAVSIPAPNQWPQLQFAAVLTIVNAPIINSTEVFRPGYFGATKTFYNTASIRAAARVGTVAATALPAVAGFPISTVANTYKSVQLDNFRLFSGGYVFPADNMPRYGADIAINSVQSLLRMLLNDFDYSISGHRQALVNYLQMAIDLKAAVDGGNVWPANGGHANGRKLPLYYAAWVFNDPSFIASVTPMTFAEDTQLWRSPITGKALFGYASNDANHFPGITPAQTAQFYWSTTITGQEGASPGTEQGGRDIRDVHGYIDGGGYEVGDGYQACCTSTIWKYNALALYLLDPSIRAAWTSGNAPMNNVMTDYAERWVSVGAISAGDAPIADTCAPYTVAGTYGVDYGFNGVVNPDGTLGCVTGGPPNRWPGGQNLHPDGAGSTAYRSALGDQLWTWCKANLGPACS
jgi:hypothetical protein